MQTTPLPYPQTVHELASDEDEFANELDRDNPDRMRPIFRSKTYAERVRYIKRTQGSLYPDARV